MCVRIAEKRKEREKKKGEGGVYGEAVGFGS